MPGKGRPIRKGVSGNPGGRPKVLGDVQELARQKSPEAIETLSKSCATRKRHQLHESLLLMRCLIGAMASQPSRSRRPWPKWTRAR